MQKDDFDYPFTQNSEHTTDTLDEEDLLADEFLSEPTKTPVTVVSTVIHNEQGKKPKSIKQIEKSHQTTMTQYKEYALTEENFLSTYTYYPKSTNPDIKLRVGDIVYSTAQSTNHPRVEDTISPIYSMFGRVESFCCEKKYNRVTRMLVEKEWVNVQWPPVYRYGFSFEHPVEYSLTDLKQVHIAAHNDSGVVGHLSKGQIVDLKSEWEFNPKTGWNKRSDTESNCNKDEE